MNGPFACGSNPDVTIFRDRMKKKLDEGELEVADKGYKDASCLLSDDVPVKDRLLHVLIRARHEVVNKRFKQFAALTSCYRHKIDLHRFIFHSIANLTHLMIENNEPLFKNNILQKGT